MLSVSLRMLSVSLKKNILKKKSSNDKIHVTKAIFPSQPTMKATSHSWVFAWVNLLSVCVFVVTTLNLLRVDWKNDSSSPPSIWRRFVHEPKLGFYFLIAFASVTWLVGFFALALVNVGRHQERRKTAPLVVNAKKEEKTVSAAVSPAGLVTRTPVVILGGTGLVGRALTIRLEDHPTMRLGYMIGSPDTAGGSVADVWAKKEEKLKKQYGDMWVPMKMPEYLNGMRVASFDDVFRECAPGKVFIISCVAPALGWMEDRLIENGFDVFSISPHARTRPGVPLVVPEVNGPKELRALLQRSRNSASAYGRLVKSPNCVSCGACLVLDALSRAYGGLDEVCLTTFQSLTGRGDALYDSSLVVGNVLPLGGTEEDTNKKIREEVSRVLEKPDLRISVTAQRVYTQRGHYVDVRVKTRNPVPSEHHAALALERYAPFANTDFAKLPDAPKLGGPLRVSLESKWPRPIQAIQLGLEQDQGMTVHVGQLSTDDRVFDLTLSFVVDNVARGAYGAALLTAEVFSVLEAEQ